MRRMLIILTAMLITGVVVFGAIGADDPDPYENVNSEYSPTEARDPFIEILTGNKTGVYIGDWLNIEGESFAFSLPAGFSVKFFPDTYEIADIIFYEAVVSKIIAGYVYESEPVIDTIGKIVGEYLYNLGDYSVTESLSIFVADGSINEGLLTQLLWNAVLVRTQLSVANAWRVRPWQVLCFPRSAGRNRNRNLASLYSE